MCNNCIHKAVCSIYTATGGVKKCEHVKEERRGHWEEWYPPAHMILTGDEMLYRCTICDAKYPDVEGYRHCPYCGNPMDGERRTGGENYDPK